MTNYAQDLKTPKLIRSLSSTMGWECPKCRTIWNPSQKSCSTCIPGRLNFPLDPSNPLPQWAVSPPPHGGARLGRSCPEGVLVCTVSDMICSRGCKDGKCVKDDK